MAERETGADAEAGPRRWAWAPDGPAHGRAELLSFERVAVLGQASRIHDAGAAGAKHAAELVAALEEASAAVAGMATAVPGGLISGPALAECAGLLARRARDCAAQTDRIAEDMSRAAGVLAAADEEVAFRVADAG